MHLQSWSDYGDVGVGDQRVTRKPEGQLITCRNYHGLVRSDLGHIILDLLPITRSISLVPEINTMHWGG